MTITSHYRSHYGRHHRISYLALLERLSRYHRGRARNFIQQLRAFGSDMEILEPHYLREQFKVELEKQLALYK